MSIEDESNEKWLEELQKCMESPWYLFTRHMNNDTFLTEKEFNLIFYSYLEKVKNK